MKKGQMDYFKTSRRTIRRSTAKEVLRMYRPNRTLINRYTGIDGPEGDSGVHNQT